MVSTAVSRVNGVSTSVAVKAPVHAVATTNIVLNGLQTVGGVALDGDTLYRVLLTAQTDTTENGIWDADTGNWRRSSDFDGDGDAVSGTLIPAPAASLQVYYRVIGTNPIVPGTSAITFDSVFQLTPESSVLSTGVIYDQTSAEIAASVTPVNLNIPHHEAVGYLIADRYGTNTTPGTTDMITAINNMFLVAKQLTASQTQNFIECRLLPGKTYYISTPFRSYTGIYFNLNGGTILKSTNSTISSTLTSVLVCLDGTRPGDVSGNINCIGLIDDAIRADKVKVCNGTLTTGAANSTTSAVDHGIVIHGASNSKLEHLEIDLLARCAVLQTVCFTSTMDNVRVYKANQAFGIENGTSIVMKNNYAVNCHKYGYYIRDVKYTVFHANACDSLNNVSNSADYTDRTIDSSCYVFDACYGVIGEANGAEQCFGSWVKWKSVENVRWANNVAIGPQSSYTGANQVALYFVDTLGRKLTIENNQIMRSGTTALSGGASAGAHHDFYSNATTNLSGLRFINNYIGNNLFDAPSSIYGNNNPSYIDSTFIGAQLAGVFTPSLSMTTATDVAITYGARNVGRFSIINGFMHVDCYLHATSITFGGAIGFISIGGLPITNAGADQEDCICTKSVGVTWPSTEPYWWTVDAGFTNGLIQNRTRGTALGTGAYVTGTTDVEFHFVGDIYVGNPPQFT